MLVEDVALTEVAGPSQIFTLYEAPIQNLTLRNVSWTRRKSFSELMPSDGAGVGSSSDPAPLPCSSTTDYCCGGWRGHKIVKDRLFATGSATAMAPPLPRDCAFLPPTPRQSSPVPPKPSPAAVQIAVDLTAASARPFPHYWKRSFGSGHAALVMRDDWRAHLALAATELGMSGVRYHGLLDDDMEVVISPPPRARYNFSKIDSSWEFLLSKGVTPIVELSYMPALLGNCTWRSYNTSVAPDVVPPHGSSSP